MKAKGKHRNVLVMASAIVLSASLLTAPAPVWAADSSGENVTVSSSSDETAGKYTITFVDESGNVLDTFSASDGQTWGPSGDISVRSTYYKDGVDYDIVEGPAGALSADSPSLQSTQAAAITGNMTFTYKKHTDTATSGKTYKCMTEDGMLLYTFTGSEDKIPETLSPGSKVYTRSSKADDSTDTAVVNVYYKLASDSDTNYTVTVNYVDADGGNTITSRSFYVNNKKYIFYAPEAFSVTSGEETVNYKAVDDTTITHEVGDTTRTYSIRYRKQTADSDKSYNWYILLYNSETNRCIDSRVVEVTAANKDQAAAFTPDQTIEVNGSKYTINKTFDKQFTHKYADTDHTTYIYYDPEGYSNSSEIRTRDINIQYVDIANGNVIQSKTQTVTSEGDTRIDFPDSLDANGIHYLRVAGQVAYADHNFYSPKETYTVYYYDQNNTEFQKVVLTREEVQEVTVTDEGTTYRVIPGITRTVMTNTATGVSNIVSTNDSTGAAIAPVAAGNIANGTANDAGAGTGGNTADNGQNTAGTAGTDTTTTTTGTDNNNGTDNSADASIDGVNADDIQTPESNIKLDSEKDNSSQARNIAVIATGIAVIAACAVALFVLIRKRRISRH
ncbi:MAG: hypothetical protein ACI4ET_15870 [Bilifractor sp.]